MQDVAAQLAARLDRWGVTTIESSQRIDERLGAGTAAAPKEDSDAHHRLTLWLDDVEFWNEFVLFVPDPDASEWTCRCLRHADEVLLLARADAPAEVHEVERRLCMGEAPITGARQTLILFHESDTKRPQNTAAWLDRRAVSAHLHLRSGSDKDMARLARVASGNAVGLVLAGGGARGFAHLGAYKALRELGVEFDFVAGTSIGAAMGAFIAADLDPGLVIDLARRTFRANPTGDINLVPLLSLIKGRRLKRSIDGEVEEIYGPRADVVDTWKTFCCVATNFSQACEKAIARGPLAKAVRASVSIPVALPPVPWEGDLLVDGGVLNNFPTTVMMGMGARRIVGVDLASSKTRRYAHDEVPSTLELLRDRLRPRRKRKYKLPGLGTVLMNTTILYSASRRAQSRESVDIYINPDIGGLSLLEWKAFDKIVELGYESAKQVLTRMTEKDLAPYRDL